METIVGSDAGTFDEDLGENVGTETMKEKQLEKQSDQLFFK